MNGDVSLEAIGDNGVEVAPSLWERVKPWLFPVTLLLTMLASAFMPDAAMAATLPHGHLMAGGGNIPAVNYGPQNGAGAKADTTVTNAMESVAETIRLVLGATALVVILAAAVMNHFVHDPRAKERAKELIGAAVVGLLLAAFAPQIVNFIASL